MQFDSPDSIVGVDHPALRQHAKHVPKSAIGSKDLAKLIAHMRKLLAREKNGVGLAAPQVGVPIQLFIVAGRVFEDDEDADKKHREKIEKGMLEPHPGDRVFINPELPRVSRKKKEMSEGCLSVRGIYGTVMRHEKASLKAVGETGQPVAVNATGLLAHIFQHEMDHLNGILFIDKAETLEDEKKRDRVT
jgi:peptide deformylase